MFPAAVAASLFVHGATGAGGSHRSRPTGGAAYGTPRYDVTPFIVTPQTGPLFV
jgi:hypothetical protein